MALAVRWDVPYSAVAALLCLLLTPDRQWHCQDEMSDTGLTVPGMTGPSLRYDITITVDRDGGHLPNPAEFAVTAQQAASARGAAIVSAHTAGQIICVVTIHALGPVRGRRRRPGRGLRSAQTPGRVSRPLIRQLTGLLPAAQH